MQNNGEKFFFNVNVFDDDAVPNKVRSAKSKSAIIGRKEEQAPPPPPTFSEEDLAQAKKEAFAEGRKMALEESKASREQKTADTIKRISQSIAPLFDAEDAREDVYESEAVSLSLAIFKKLFPIYAEKYNFEELKATISTILSTQSGQKSIAVYLAHEDILPITEILKASSEIDMSRITIKEDGNAVSGYCSLSWDDGGAIKDINTLSTQIEEIMHSALDSDGFNIEETLNKKNIGTDNATDHIDIGVNPINEVNEPVSDIKDDLSNTHKTGHNDDNKNNKVRKPKKPKNRVTRPKIQKKQP